MAILDWLTSAVVAVIKTVLISEQALALYGCQHRQDFPLFLLFQSLHALIGMVSLVSACQTIVLVFDLFDLVFLLAAQLHDLVQLIDLKLFRSIVGAGVDDDLGRLAVALSESISSTESNYCRDGENDLFHGFQYLNCLFMSFRGHFHPQV